MAEAPVITVRKATSADYEGVLDINRNVYEGFDYVHLYYEDLINDPDASYYVCEVDGEVGAFEGMFLLDEGDTLMARSARVKDKFQGQGLLNHIRKRVYEDYKDVPGRKRIRNCCTNMVRLVNSPKFLSQNKSLAKRILCPFEGLENIVFPTDSQKFASEISELPLEELSSVFASKELVTYLFPEGFVSNCSWFFEPLASNIRHIKKQFTYVSVSASLKENIHKFASSSDKMNEQKNAANPQNSANEMQEKFGTQLADEGNQKIVKCKRPHQLEGLMIFSSHYHTPTSFFYWVDVFGEPSVGREEQDVREIIHHSLIHALSEQEKHSSKLPISVAVSLTDGADAAIYIKVLSEFGFRRGEVAKIFTGHYYFEQDFEKLVSQ